MNTESKVKTRVLRHRSRNAVLGSRRLEVTVPAGDAALVKAVAGVLRAGGADARSLREALLPMVATPKARTGAELVRFFRASPLAETGLAVERDASTGRSVDLE
mgnify:CR=1 FL=1